MLLRDLGENGLIQRIRGRFPSTNAVLGIGDDAALLRVPPGCHLVYCSDLVVENTHFLRGIHPAESVGYKAVAVNVSDVGAMGGTPRYFLLSLAAPGDLPVSWIDTFLGGIERACKDFDVSLVGGDTSSSAQIFADVAMVGTVPEGAAVRRSGATPGDRIYVTGVLGSSALGLERLRAGDSDSDAARRHLYPSPRHRIGALSAAGVHAMIDVSDGLSTDLAHIAEESKVTARIYKERIPGADGATAEQILHGGEEYELILVAPEELPGSIDGVGITQIGEIVAPDPRGKLLLVAGGVESVLASGGWRHF